MYKQKPKPFSLQIVGYCPFKIYLMFSILFLAPVFPFDTSFVTYSDGCVDIILTSSRLLGRGNFSPFLFQIWPYWRMKDTLCTNCTSKCVRNGYWTLSFHYIRRLLNDIVRIYGSNMEVAFSCESPKEISKVVVADYLLYPLQHLLKQKILACTKSFFKYFVAYFQKIHWFID